MGTKCVSCAIGTVHINTIQIILILDGLTMRHVNTYHMRRITGKGAAIRDMDAVPQVHKVMRTEASILISSAELPLANNVIKQGNYSDYGCRIYFNAFTQGCAWNVICYKSYYKNAAP
jgi:hypothetical protein